MRINTITVTLILSLLISCSKKSEKDYVGKYKTFYATRIELGNAFSGLLLTTKAPEPTAKSFYDLGEINIELFDGKDGFQGEGFIVVKSAQNMSFSPTETVKKMSLDFSNFRTNGDTLIFSLENEILRLEGKKLKAMIVKNKSGVYLGLDKNFGIKTVAGPFDAKEKDGIQFFECYEKPKTLELSTEFFKAQEKELTARIKNEPKSNARKILENSLDEVKKQLAAFSL